MLRMRLTRTGAKKRPSYRVVVADSRAPRDGRHVDILGFYDPMTSPSTIRIDTDRAVKWLQNGAQPSDRVRILLRHAGVLKAHEEARLEAKRERKAEREANPRLPRPVKAAKAAAGAAVTAVKRAAKAAAKTVDAATDAVAEAAPKASRRRTTKDSAAAE